MEIKEKLSTLWIVVMFNMAFADILSFMLEISNDIGPEIQATEALMLVAAVFIEIPVVMIFLSRLLKYKTNRLANIVAGIITILFVVGGGSLSLHYIFIASVEVICMLAIIWLAWRWQPED